MEAMDAKHEGMKKEKRPLRSLSNELVQLPAFPIAGNKIFERIAAAVTASRGYLLKRQDLARLMGQLPTTTSCWFSGSNQPHLTSLFCLLEQLAPDDRIRAITKLCRELPSLEDPRFRHDQIAVSALKQLLGHSSNAPIVVNGTAPA